MAQPWFRFYHETLDDPKVQTLPPDVFKNWVNCLCLAARNNGFIGDISTVSFAFRCGQKQASEMLQQLDSYGLLDKKFGKYTPHNWFKRQYKSDISTERVKRHRQKKRNVSPALHETPPEQIQNRTDTEQREGDSPDAEKRVGRPRDLAADLFTDAYLRYMGNPYGTLGGDFPQLMKLRKRLKIGNLDTPDSWADAIENYFASPFSEFSLQHFASKFDTFKNSSLDRFKVPTNHVNGGNGNGKRETDHQKNNRVLQGFLDRNLAPEVFGDVSDVRKDPE